MLIFCILAHHNPQALARLLQKLENFYVVVHLDKNVEIENFKSETPSSAKVYWLEGNARIRTNWGGWSIVEAQIELMKFAYSRFS